MMKKRVAALDIGSNSVRMLVADIEGKQIHTITKDRRVTRLFAGLKDGELNADSIARTAAVIGEFAEAARAAGAEEIMGFGTSAMREGRNRDELIAFSRETGVEVVVLSGEEEAQLAYEGAAPEGRTGVLDIGGGSTEMIVGENGIVKRGASARIGAVRMQQQLSTMQPSPRALVAHAREAIAQMADGEFLGEAENWVAVGGTVTTLAAMLLQLEPYDDRKVDNVRLTARIAQSFLDLIWAMPVHLRAQLKGLDLKRADIIPYGIAILLAFFETAGIDAITVSAQDNLTGFLRQRAVNAL